LACAALVTGACGGGDSDPEAAAAALHAAVTYAGRTADNIPAIGQYYACIIQPARQPTPPAPTFLSVRASCLWSVAPQDEQWLVTFSETWSCSAWTAEVQGYPPCDGATGNHQWEYLVDLTTGNVQIISDRGQFAPDM
jgi:hypothetical protein